MESVNGEWYIKGLSWNDPYRIRSAEELVSWVNEVGFLPLFANEIDGFSAEEHVSPDFWFSGDREQDPWEWREIISAGHEVAYGKFFAGRAGFISREWLPYFANYRRDGYDFDARWEDGLASFREKLIMDHLTAKDSDGDVIFDDIRILSTELKKKAGFSKDGFKNFPGITTGLQMQTYLVITDFQRRRNRKGNEYGMSVSILQPPEVIWGYETVTSAYDESPAQSWERITVQLKKAFFSASDQDVIKLIGKRP